MSAERRQGLRLPGFVNRLLKRTPQQLEVSFKMEREYPTAPDGTNKLLLPLAGLRRGGFDIPGHDTIIIDKEDCKGGVCVDVAYSKRDMNGDDIVFRAHVMSDDRMEHVLAMRRFGSNLYDVEFISIESAFNMLKTRLTELGLLPNESPTPTPNS